MTSPGAPSRSANHPALAGSRIAERAAEEHRRKNALFVISQWAELLEDRWGDLDDSLRQQGLSTIRRVTNELLEESERALAGARAEARVEAGDTVLLDLAGVATVAASGWSVPGRSRVVVEVDGEVPVVADPASLQQVIGHLVENAVRYSPDATPVVVRVRREASFGELEVIDEGVGIPLGVDLFAPFERGDMDDRGIPGTGIGLYVVAQLLRAMGGTITAERREQGGSRFSVRLPLAIDLRRD